MYQILVQNCSLVLRWVYCSKILVELVKLSALETYLEQLSPETEVLKAEACVELLGSTYLKKIHLRAHL